MLLLSSADFFSKLPCSKNSFEDTIRVSNSLDPDQDQCFVGPDLGPNYLLQCTTGPHSAAGNMSGYIWDLTADAGVTSSILARSHTFYGHSPPFL